jgi:hypothetical protein
MRTSIYALIDPRESDPIKQVRYIGKTCIPRKARLYQHIHESIKYQVETHKCRWIRKCIKDGNCPKILKLERVTSNGSERERYWIDWYIRSGAKLTNATSGGDGCTYVDTPAGRSTREKKHTYWLEMTKKQRDIIITNMRKGHIGKTHTTETKDKMRQAALRRWSKTSRNERVAHMSKAQRGKRPTTEATRMKMSNARKGKYCAPKDPEQAKLNSSIALKKYYQNMTEQQRLSMSRACEIARKSRVHRLPPPK